MEQPAPRSPRPGNGRAAEAAVRAGRSRLREAWAFRVYFAPFPDHGIVLLAALFGKNERSDLTVAERQEIARQLARIRELLDRGLIR